MLAQARFVQDTGAPLPFSEPTDICPSDAQVLLGYLDYFRSVLVTKVQGLPGEELRAGRLLSGWTPLAPGSVDRASTARPITATARSSPRRTAEPSPHRRHDTSRSPCMLP